MADLGQLGKFFVGIGVDMSELKSGMQQATDSITSTASGISTQMQKASDDTSTAMKKLADETGNAMGTASSAVSRAGGVIGDALDKVKSAFGAVGIAIDTYLGTAIKASLDFQSAILAMTRTTGMATEQAGLFSYALKRTGTDADTFRNSVMFLSRGVNDAKDKVGEGKTKFEEYGVAITDATGKVLPMDAILKNIMQRYSEMPAGIERNAMAMELLRDRTGQLTKFLSLGEAGLKKFSNEAKKAGVDLGDINAQKAFVAMNKAVKGMNDSMDLLKIQVGNQFMPVMTALATVVTKVVGAFQSIPQPIREVAIEVITVTALIATMWGGWSAVTAILIKLGGPMATIGTQMAGMPNLITAVTAGFAGLCTWLADATIALVSWSTYTSLAETAQIAFMYAMDACRAVGLALSSSLSGQGVASLVSYVAGLNFAAIGANICRVALIALYSTVLIGVVVVGALAMAWTTNFGNIQNATAGICDGISYGLSNFADGIAEIAKGIGNIFLNLAKTIGSAITGDFSGAIDNAKNILGGVLQVGKGAWGAIKGFGQVAYSVVTDTDNAVKYFKVAGQSIYSGAKGALGLDGINIEQPPPPAGTEIPTAGGSGGGSGGSGGGNGGAGKQGKSAYDIAKEKYQEEIKLADFTAEQKLAIYKKYLEQVQKDENETTEYKVGLHEHEYAISKEALERKKTDLDLAFAQELYVGQVALDKKRQLSNEELNDYIAYSLKIRKEFDKRTDDEITADIKATAEYKKLLKEKYNADREYNTYARELKKSQEIADLEHNNAVIALESQKNADLKDLGIISNRDYLDMQVRETNIEKEQSLKRAQIEYDSGQKTEKDAQALANAKVKIQDDYNKKIAKLDQQRLLESHKVELSIADGIAKSFGDSTKKLFMFEMSWKEAWKALGQAMRESIASALADMVQTQVKSYLTKSILKTKDSSQEVQKEVTKQSALTSAMTAGENARQAIAQMSHKAIGAMGGASAIAMVTANASAFTALLAMMTAEAQAIALIPPTGPAMAGAMMAGIGTATGAVTASTASATAGITSAYASLDVGTMRVPQDMLANIHKDELIVPAPFAEGARTFISNGGFNGTPQNGGGGDVHIHAPLTVQAIDRRGVEGALKQHANTIGKIVNTQVRDFKLKSKV